MSRYSVATYPETPRTVGPRDGPHQPASFQERPATHAPVSVTATPPLPRLRLGRITSALLLACYLPMASAQLVADPGMPDAAQQKDVLPYAIDRDGPGAPTVSTVDGDGFVTLSFGPGKPQDAPGWLVIRPREGHWDWHAVKSLRMHVQNAMPWALTLLMQLKDEQGQTLQATLALPPSGPFALAMPLSATLPLQMGMRSGPVIPWTVKDTNGAESPQGLVETTVGTLDTTKIREIRIGMPPPDAEQKIRLGKVFLPPIGTDDLQAGYTGIIDAYGQYTRADWPGKYRLPRKLARALEEATPPDVKAARRKADGVKDVRDLDGDGKVSKREQRLARTEEQAEKRLTARQKAKRAKAWRDAQEAARADFALHARQADQKLANALAALQDEDEENAGSSYSADKHRPALDRFGGITGIEGSSHGSGWFRTGHLTLKDGSQRHILITPEGNPFFSFGVNAVQRDNSETFVGGREFQFTSLPVRGMAEYRFTQKKDSTETLPADSGAQRNRRFLKGQTHDFYHANLYRRDGDDWAQRWVTRTGKRLKSWGFNTVGAWSDDSMNHVKLPYTRIAHVSGPFARLSDGNDWWQGIPDAFDPVFGQALEATLKKETASSQDDPYLIGWFVDNELGWGNGSAPDPLVRYALAYSALKMDAAQPQAHAKRALVKLLRERYNDDVQELARVWQQPLSDWRALEAAWPAERLPDGRNPHVAADLSAFLRLHAETYYSQVAQALKKHDPHHLYLGSRFAGRTPESIAACARWCDVVSFNLYIPSLREGFEAEEFARIDKPALLTEFHFGSSDRGPFWPGVMVVNTEAERGPAYRKMLESVLANRQFVGAHWFQYLDQPVTGRWLDGENGHLGLVGITDVPWHDFVLSVARTNRDVLGQLRREAASVSVSAEKEKTAD